MPWGGLGAGYRLLIDRDASEYWAGILSSVASKTLTLSSLVTLGKDFLLHASIFPPIQWG